MQDLYARVRCGVCGHPHGPDHPPDCPRHAFGPPAPEEPLAPAPAAPAPVRVTNGSLVNGSPRAAEVTGYPSNGALTFVAARALRAGAPADASDADAVRTWEKAAALETEREAAYETIGRLTCRDLEVRARKTGSLAAGLTLVVAYLDDGKAKAVEEARRAGVAEGTRLAASGEDDDEYDDDEDEEYEDDDEDEEYEDDEEYGDESDDDLFDEEDDDEPAASGPRRSAAYGTPVTDSGPPRPAASRPPVAAVAAFVVVACVGFLSGVLAAAAALGTGSF